MLIEREFHKENSLFARVSPGEQKSAATRFIQSTQQLVTKQGELDYLTVAEEKINKPEINGATAIRAAIHCFDLYLSDEIRSYLLERSPQSTDRAAVYFRSDVYKQTYPQQVTDVLSKMVGHTTNVVIATKEHIERFSQDSGFIGLLTPDLAYWVDTEDNPIVMPDPPCGVSRQELYRSMLSCGVNPLENMETAVSEKSEGQRDEVAPDVNYIKRFRRKGEVSMLATENDLALWQDRSSIHWASILEEASDSSADSVLFSSGTSATEAALLAIANKGCNSVFAHPYWYYENMTSAQTLFQVSDGVSESTQAVLINLEPTNFFTFDGATINDPIQAIKDLVEISRNDPETDRYAVVDVTVNPLFRIEEHIDGSLPTNIQIIKTLSASKHQRGGRKYFFGVAYTSGVELSQEISEARPLVGGNLYEPHIVHFPRPSAKWLATQRDTVRSLNAQIAELNPDDSVSNWSLTPHTYHTFFFPPTEVLESIQRLGRKNGDVGKKVRQFNDVVDEVVASVIKEINSPFIDIGDSFGLPQTRAGTQGGFTELNGLKFRLKLPRICPGYDTPPELVMETAKRILVNLTSSRDEIMATLK